jgi:uncharacterized protein YoxC
MQRLWLIIFCIVVAAALVLLFVGVFGTEHKIYTRFDETVKGYKASDPVRIREWSFG